MRASRRGFTLIELLVGAAVASIVLLGISMAFISQARQYQAHASRRGLQSNVRQAMAFLERSVRRAGYGVDPDRAILAYDSYDPSANVQGSGFPDAIVLHSRDPLFQRQATAVTTTQLTFSSKLNEPLYQGQILLVLCPGARTYAYVTVGIRANTNDTAVTLDNSIPSPATDSPRGAPGILFHEQANLASACFTGSEKPWVVKINRTAFYVASFNNIPYLMMHRGLDISGGATGTPDGLINEQDAVPVAEGIEQMQVAYVLNALHSSDTTVENKVPTIVGVDNTALKLLNGSTLTWPYGEQWPQKFASDKPAYSDGYDAPVRFSSHPANIRQVRVTLVSRSTIPDPQLLKDPKYRGDNALNPTTETWTSGSYNSTTTWAQLENLPATPNATFDPRGGGFYRVVLRQTIAPKNMLSRSQFLPITVGGG